MGSVEVVEGLAVVAQLPLLSALLRRPERRDLPFWLSAAVACLAAALVAARAALAEGAADGLGDATMLPDSLDTASASDVARVFGQGFAQALAALPVGGWQGPVQSSYGVHLVEISAREPGRLPSLVAVRAAVERDLLSARADQSAEAFYQSLRQRYTVRIESGPETAEIGAQVGTLAGAR